MSSSSIAITSRKKKWPVILTSALALSMVVFESTAFPICIPYLQQQFEFSSQMVFFIINVFFLFSSATVLIAGKLADWFGCKHVYIAGLLIFGFASIYFTSCHDALGFCIARALQGIGVAGIITTSVLVLLENLKENELGRAQGLTSAFATIFLCLGPFFAGFCVELLSWKVLFYAFAIFSFFGALLVFWFTPSSKRVAKEKRNWTYLLVIGILAFFTVLLFSLLTQQKMRAVPWLKEIVILFGITGVWAVWYAKKHTLFKDEERLFKEKNFSVGVTLLFLFRAIAAAPFIWAIYFQEVMFYSPVDSGAYLLISTLPAMIVSPVSGTLCDNVGPKIPLVIGLGGLLCGVILLMRFSQTCAIHYLTIGLLLYGFGTAMIAAPINIISFLHVENSMRGLASGIYNTSRFIGGSIGITCISIVHEYTSGKRFELLKSIHAIGDTLSIKQAYQYLVERLPQLEVGAQKIKEIYIIASSHGLNYVHIVIGFFTICALLLTTFGVNEYRKENEITR